MKKILLILLVLVSSLSGKGFYVINKSSLTIKEINAIKNDTELLNRARGYSYGEISENTTTEKIMLTGCPDAEKLSVVKNAIKNNKVEKVSQEKYNEEKKSNAGFTTVEAVGIVAVILGLVGAYLKTGNIWFLVGAGFIIVAVIVALIIRRQK